MLELKEQNFVAQKCGDNCTCHNHINKDTNKSKNKKLKRYKVNTSLQGENNETKESRAPSTTNV